MNRYKAEIPVTWYYVIDDDNVTLLCRYPAQGGWKAKEIRDKYYPGKRLLVEVAEIDYSKVSSDYIPETPKTGLPKVEGTDSC